MADSSYFGGRMPSGPSGRLRHEWVLWEPNNRGISSKRDRVGRMDGTPISGNTLSDTKRWRRGFGQRYSQGFLLPQNNRFDFPGGFTLEAYVTDFNISPYGMFVHNYNASAAPYTGWAWGQGPLGRRLSYWNSTRGTWVESTTTLGVGQPIHVATVINANGSGTHYINGKADPTTISAIATPSYDGGTHRALCGIGGFTYPYGGSVAYVRIYDVPLSSREIHRLSNVADRSPRHPFRGSVALASRAYYYRNFVASRAG